jgi:hypothetical protein
MDVEGKQLDAHPVVVYSKLKQFMMPSVFEHLHSHITLDTPILLRLFGSCLGGLA